MIQRLNKEWLLGKAVLKHMEVIQAKLTALEPPH